MPETSAQWDEVVSDEYQGQTLVRPAATVGELEEAYRLVYQNYLRRGYIAEDRCGMRFSLFNALPDTVTFIGLAHDQIVATVTVVPDSEMGLPMDEIYHPEIQALRLKERRMVEVTMLADRRLSIRRSFPMVLRLMKQAIDYTSLFLKAHDICFTVNPHHEKFYRDFMLCHPLGELRAYPSVQNNPAVAYRLDVSHLDEDWRDHPRLHKTFLVNRTPLHSFEQRCRFASADIEHLFVRVTPWIQHAPEATVRCLRHYYPDYPWDSWQRTGL